MGSVLQAQVSPNIGPSATPSFAFGSNVTSGSLLVARLSSNSAFNVNTITDTLGTIYTLVITYTAQGDTISVHVGIAPKGGANTVQWNLSASVNSRPAIIEAPGFTTTLDGAAQGYNGAATQSPATGPFTTTKPGDLVLTTITCGSININPAAPWVTVVNGTTGISYQIPGASGTFTTSWHTGSTAAYAAIMMAFTPTPPAPSTVTPTVGDNAFTLLAKSNRPLGGSGVTTSDNELTLLAKQLRLLGASAAQANTNWFVLLARINQQLGGTGTTPSDNIFTLLAKQNRLLGGSGASASDTCFTLLAKNSKLLHH